MRDVVHDEEPLWPVGQHLRLAAVDRLVYRRDELPDVAEQEDPDDGHGDPGQPVFRLPVLDIGRRVDCHTGRIGPERSRPPEVARDLIL